MRVRVRGLLSGIIDDLYVKQTSFSMLYINRHVTTSQQQEERLTAQQQQRLHLCAVTIWDDAQHMMMALMCLLMSRFTILYV